MDKQAYKKAYYQANKEQLIAYSAAYEKAHVERTNQRKKAWHEAHKEQAHQHEKEYRERTKEQRRLYLEANKERRAQVRKAHYEANRERLLQEGKARYEVRKASVEAYQIAKAYNITMDSWNALYEQQDGCCAICQTPLDCGKNTHVDHCHESGTVRGLLCSNCNSGIGLLSDSPDMVLRAYHYLCHWTATTGETEEHQSGSIYLDINGVGDWSLQVQEMK